MSQILESNHGRPPLVVDDLVPTIILGYRLGRTHVGTSALDVARDIYPAIKKAAATDPRWTPAIRKQTVAAALWLHAENRAEYAWVMGGLK